MDFINLLLKSFDTYAVWYRGKGVSWNEIYGSNNWGVRKGLADKYKKIFYWLFKEAKLPRFDKFGLVIYYNSRMDADNVSCTAKFALDVLKQEWVKDDSKKYCRGVFILPDESLDFNTYKFLFVKLK